MIESKPRIITGIFAFSGQGLTVPTGLDGAPSYRVPADRRSQFIYLRAGNSSDALVALMLLRDGTPMRLFPIGARSGLHVPLAVVEDLFPETLIEIKVGAPEGVAGHIVLDMGLIEI